MAVSESIGCKSPSISCAEHHLTCSDTGRVIAIEGAKYSFSPNCTELSSNETCTEYFSRCCNEESTECLIDFTGSDMNNLEGQCSNKGSCSLEGFSVDKFPGCHPSNNSQSVVYYRCIGVPEEQVYGGSPVGVIIGCLIAVIIVILIIIVVFVVLRRRRKRRHHEEETHMESLYINRTESTFMIDSIPPTVPEYFSDIATAPYATSSLAKPDDTTENKIITDNSEIDDKPEMRRNYNENNNEDKGDNPNETRPLHAGKENRNSFFKPISPDSNTSDTGRKSQIVMKEVDFQRIPLLETNADDS